MRFGGGLGQFGKAISEIDNELVGGAKDIGAGFSEISKGVQTGDLGRVTSGYGDIIEATPGGQLQKELARADAGGATAGVPTIPEIQEKLRQLDPTVALGNIGMSGADIDNILTNAGQSQFTGQTSDLFGAIDPFTVQAIEAQKAAQMAGVADIGIGDPSQFLAQQANLAGILQGQVAGTQPSLAQAQLTAERDRMLNQQAALAASMSGRALPAAQRQLAQQAATSQQQLGQQAAILRAQEQQAAQQQLAQLLGTARGQDLQREGLGLTAAQANQQAALETQKANLLAEQEAARQDLMAQTRAAELGLQAQTQSADAALQRELGKADLATSERQISSQEAMERLRQEQENKRREAELKAGMAAAALGAGSELATGWIAGK